MLPSWVAYLATLLIIWGTVGYIWDIRHGRVAPNLVTWFLWSLAPLITLGAQLKAGVGAEAALAATAGLCPSAVLIAGLRQGTFRPQRFDWWCGGVSLLALLLWLVTGSGLVGVGLSIIADGFGAAPTLRKSWRDPTSESPHFFALFALSAFITLLTVTQWTMVHVAFTLYIFMLYAVLFLLVQFKVGQRFQRPMAVIIDET
ncbi:MAG TPA: hypothetical protein VFZ58_04955 [Candidatus Saccharimonadales bacterium]